MENLTNRYIYSGQRSYANGSAGTATQGSSSFYTNISVIKSSSQPKRRVKPMLYQLPRYGTDSYIYRQSIHELQTGVFGNPNLWKPYGSSAYGYVPGQAIENAYDRATSAEVLLMSENDTRAANRVIDEIISGRSQLSVDLIQLGQTKNLLADAGINAYRALRNLRSGRTLNSILHELRTGGWRSKLAEQWLAYIYGWVPTVSGLYDTMDIVSNNIIQGSLVTGKIRVQNVKQGSLPNNYAQTSYKCVLRTKANFEYTISDPKLLRLAQLGFTNPAMIVWELLPWSFLFDWFNGFGDYVQRMDYAVGIKDVNYQLASRRVCTTYNDYYRTSLPNQIFNPTQHCIMSTSTVTYKRSPPKGFPVSSYEGWRMKSFGSDRLKTSLALIQTNILAKK